MSQVRTIRLPYGVRVVLELDAAAAQHEIRVHARQLSSPAAKSALMNQLAGAVREDVRQQFREGGNPAWADLAPGTIEEKTQAGLPALTAKGRVPWRLKQNGVFGPANKLIRVGALRDSWSLKNNPNHVEVIDTNRMTLRFGSNLWYAIFHQKGTKPYLIRPRKAKALRFTGPNGEQVLANVVHHPGLKARPVRVTARLMRQMQAILMAHLEGKGSGVRR